MIGLSHARRPMKRPQRRRLVSSETNLPLASFPSCFVGLEFTSDLEERVEGVLNVHTLLRPSGAGYISPSRPASWVW